MIQHHFFVCRCYSPEHTLQVVLDEEADELYFVVYLRDWSNFWKRLWHGLKYVLGTSPGGVFAEYIFNPKDVSRMIAVLRHVEKKDGANV